MTYSLRVKPIRAASGRSDLREGAEARRIAETGGITIPLALHGIADRTTAGAGAGVEAGAPCRQAS